MERDISIKLVTVNDYPDFFHGATLMHSIEPTEKYTVVLNDDKDELYKTATFLHEMLHVFHGDNISTEDVEEIESKRRAELLQVLRILTEEGI